MLLRNLGSTFLKLQPKFQAYNTPLYYFSVTKREKMALTLKTPEKVILKDFSDFYRVITRTKGGALVIQNKTPPCYHELPAGTIKIKMTDIYDGNPVEYIHNGGAVTVFA